MDWDRAYERYFDKLDGRWNWHGELILPGRPSRDEAVAAIKRWLRDLEKEEGGRGFRWAWLLNRGADQRPDYGQDDRFLVLVGGLQNRIRTWEEHWDSSSGGRSVIQKFHRKDLVDFLKSTEQSEKLHVHYQI